MILQGGSCDAPPHRGHDAHLIGPCGPLREPPLRHLDRAISYTARRNLTRYRARTARRTRVREPRLLVLARSFRAVLPRATDRFRRQLRCLITRRTQSLVPLDASAVPSSWQMEPSGSLRGIGTY